MHNRQSFFSCWTIFCPLTPLPSPPLTTQKIKILKKWKKHLEISPFYITFPRIMIRCYTASEIWRMTDVLFIFHFGLFFGILFLIFYPPLHPYTHPAKNPKNQDLKNMKKKTAEEIITWHACTKNYDLMM